MADELFYDFRYSNGPVVCWKWTSVVVNPIRERYVVEALAIATQDVGHIRYIS